MDVLDENWTPSQDTLDILKLNGLSDEHIQNCLTYLKSKFLNTHIDDIDGYDSWGAMFIVFCIKANNETQTRN